MAESSVNPKLSTPAPVWQMPIRLENYSHQSPLVTDEEAELMERYATGSRETGINGKRASAILTKLRRLDKPYLDAFRLRSQSPDTVVKPRRHLFRYMLQTRKAFWSWSHETWSEVIQAAYEGKSHNQAVRFHMLTLAYLFSGFLYVDTLMPYRDMAEAIFGKERVDTELTKLSSPLLALGYSHRAETGGEFYQMCALALLVNRSPYAEALSPQTLITVNELISGISESMAKKMDRKQELIRLQTSLCELDILDEPVLLALSDQAPVYPPDLWRKDTSIDPTWLSWICAFYEQTPYRLEKTMRNVCYFLLKAGRWLKDMHPEIREPVQWDEFLANEYVTYSCQALCGEYMSLSNQRYAKFQKTPQKLSPSCIDHRLVLQ